MGNQSDTFCKYLIIKRFKSIAFAVRIHGDARSEHQHRYAAVQEKPVVAYLPVEKVREGTAAVIIVVQMQGGFHVGAQRLFCHPAPPSTMR